MTIYRIHRAVVITALMTLMALLLMSCGSAPETTMPGHGGPAVAAADVAAVTEYSVHDLEAEWQDQQGLTLTLADLAGRPRIVAMVYTSCAHACPRILADMERIEGELRSAGIDAGY